MRWFFKNHLEKWELHINKNRYEYYVTKQAFKLLSNQVSSFTGCWKWWVLDYKFLINISCKCPKWPSCYYMGETERLLCFWNAISNSWTKLHQVFLRIAPKHIKSNPKKIQVFVSHLKKLRQLSVASKGHFRNDRAIKKWKKREIKLLLCANFVSVTLRQQGRDDLLNRAVWAPTLTLWSSAVVSGSQDLNKNGKKIMSTS